MNTLRAFLLIGLFLISSVLSAEAGKWNELKSSHFVVYYKEIPLSFVQTVADSAESSYREITANLGFSREQHPRVRPVGDQHHPRGLP